jgi:hypothetical protein
VITPDRITIDDEFKKMFGWPDRRTCQAGVPA